MQSVVALSVAISETIFHPITSNDFYGIVRNRKETARMQTAFCMSSTSDVYLTKLIFQKGITNNSHTRCLLPFLHCILPQLTFKQSIIDDSSKQIYWRDNYYCFGSFTFDEDLHRYRLDSPFLLPSQPLLINVHRNRCNTNFIRREDCHFRQGYNSVALAFGLQHRADMLETKIKGFPEVLVNMKTLPTQCPH